MPELQGRTAFHARVAANALEIVERELELAPAAEQAEAERLCVLLGRTDADRDALQRELCRRIRDGQFGLDTPGLMEHLWETTLSRLAVDQPGYASYKLALGERSRKEES